MIQENGTVRENQNELLIYQQQQLSKSEYDQLSFSIDFDISGDRQVTGVAHYEEVDRENEIILIGAIQKSLEDYMKHPIAHYQHTERPVGTFTKCEIKDKALHVACDIYNTKDTDDVWTEIEKGVLSKFSIFGRRKQASPECALSPNQRIKPCITKALDLFSISLVGGNAINEKTFLEMVKGFPFDEYYNSPNILKAEDTNSNLIHTTTDGTMDEPEDDKLIRADTNMSEVMKRLGAVEEAVKCFQTEKKAEEEDKMEDEKKEEEVQKAGPASAVEPEPKLETPKVEEPVVKAEVITKAFVEDEIKKAYDEIRKSLDDFKTRLEVVEKSRVEKGGTVVIMAPDFEKERESINPKLMNIKKEGAK